eukprot:1141859-Pelagomonas_calceolata.AAC.8
MQREWDLCSQDNPWHPLAFGSDRTEAVTAELLIFYKHSKLPGPLFLGVGLHSAGPCLEEMLCDGIRHGHMHKAVSTGNMQDPLDVSDPPSVASQQLLEPVSPLTARLPPHACHRCWASCCKVWRSAQRRPSCCSVGPAADPHAMAPPPLAA